MISNEATFGADIENREGAGKNISASSMMEIKQERLRFGAACFFDK